MLAGLIAKRALFMSSVSHLMSHDHRRCDDLFATAESAIDAMDFDAAAQAWAEFHEATEAHFGLEESALFPAFEEVTGMTSGPTVVMRGEHKVMRTLLQTVGEAIAKEDASAALGHCQSLIMYMQQHNMKEEQVLYPMLNGQLPAQETCDMIRQALPVTADV